MRADLLEAHATVDWAIAQTEVLDKRIKSYVESDPCPTFSEIDPRTGHKLVKIQQRIPVPLVIGVEAGIIVHAIRASLDLLATTLAKRNGGTDVSEVHFPISAGEDVFRNDGMKKIKGLSKGDVQIIESLKPYKGGNDLLYSMHQMDIMRKHRRLVLYGAIVRSIAIQDARIIGGFELRQFDRLEDAAVLFTTPAEADYKVQIGTGVSFREGGVVSGRPVIAVLYDFASLANSIIKLFDI